MRSDRSTNLLLRAYRVAAAVAVLFLESCLSVDAAQDSLVNCNELMLQDRCACNDRVLHALTRIQTGVTDGELVSGAPATADPISILQERQHRLRTYLSPNCDRRAEALGESGRLTPERLPIPERNTTRPLGGRAIDHYFAKPSRTEDIRPGDDKLLVGRWEGWLTLFGGKPAPISFHVISLGNPQPLAAPELDQETGAFLKVCSDQGMVFGRVRDGHLDLPRSDRFGSEYSIRLWRSGRPRSRDLEGVALLEVRPGQTMVAGLVWLERAFKFDWTTPPSSYFCQDRDLEEQRKDVQEQQRRRIR